MVTVLTPPRGGLLARTGDFPASNAETKASAVTFVFIYLEKYLLARQALPLKEGSVKDLLRLDNVNTRRKYTL